MEIEFWKEIEHNVERRILYYGEGTKDSGAKNSKTLSLAGRLIETARGGLVLPTRDWKMRLFAGAQGTREDKWDFSSATTTSSTRMYKVSVV